LQHAVEILANLMIPKSQHNNSLAKPGISTALGHGFGPDDSYVHRRLIRQPASRSHNRNPKRNHRLDVGGEICNLQNCGSVSVAKECVQAQSASCVVIERDPQR